MHPNTSPNLQFVMGNWCHMPLLTIFQLYQGDQFY